MPKQPPTDAEIFYEYLGEQIKYGGRDISPVEHLADWRKEFEEAVEDIREGMRNLEAGNYRTFEEFDAEMRQKYGITD